MREGRWSWLIAAAMLASLAVMYACRGGETLWFLLILTGCMVVQGIVFCWLGPKRVQASRRWQPCHPQAGEAVEVEIVFTISGGLIPLSLWARDRWSALGREIGSSSPPVLTGEGEVTGKRRGWIGQNRQFNCKYVLYPSARGHYEAGELFVIWSDPFGWFRRKKHVAVDGRDRLIVHPAPLTMALGDETKPWGAWERRQAMGQLLPTPLEEADGLRKYLPGDSLKWVEWKHSAKRGELLTRISRESLAEEHYLLLDTAAEAYQLEEAGKDGEQAVQAFETALSAASAVLRERLSPPGQDSVSKKYRQESSSIWFICGMRHTSPALAKEHLQGSEGRISGLNRLAGLSLDRGEKSLTAASMLSSSARPSGGYRFTLITGRCTQQLFDAVLLAASRGGCFEVLLAADFIPDSEETVRIERLRHAGIHVVLLTSDPARKHPSIRPRSVNVQSAKGGAGHVIA